MRIIHAARATTPVFMCLAAMACGTAARNADVVGAPLDGNSFVVRDVRVFDGQRVVERTNVVVRAGRISAVGDESAPTDLPVVDGAGRTLVPGLIDEQGRVEIAGGGDMSPGARADLVLVDGNPVADSRAAPVIVRAFKNGYDVRGTAGQTARPHTRRASSRKFPCG